MKTLLLFLAILFSASTSHAQLTRDQLDPEFQGLQTTFVYRDSTTNNIVIEPLAIRLSRIKRGTKCQTLNNLTPPESLPTASLAFEHWWLSFEMLMICQREYGACVSSINEHLLSRRQCLIDDPKCSPYATLIHVLRDYWVPPNIVFQYGVPTKEDYIAHFEAGMAGIDQLIPHIQACNRTLRSLR